MSKDEIIQAIDDSLILLMDYAREKKKPMKNIHLRDLQILFYIDQGPNKDKKVTISDLAYHFNITPAAASQIVTNYENKNWVKRVRCQEDRRTVYVEITEQIRNRFEEELNNHRNDLKKWLDMIGPEDSEALVRILNVLNENLKEENE